MTSSLFVLALGLFAGAVTAENGRIVGGNVVSSIESYPSVVQIESLAQGFFWSLQCGGSILNAIHVLSAAHCFSGRDYTAENRRIRAGTATRGSGGAVLFVDEAFNHPTYGLNGNDGDITVVRLSSAFIFRPTLNIANIVASGAILPAGSSVTKVGWGSTAVSGNTFADELQEVSVVIADHNQCRLNYESLSARPPVTENMFCAGSTIADACGGDGGGPVFIGNVVVGVISWGNGCLLSGFPGVNTNVSPYSNWIVEVVASA